MSTIDMNIAKSHIPIHIRKAFDRGEIASAYRGMYLLADRLSAIETKEFVARKPIEYLSDKIRQQEHSSASKWS